MNENVSYEIDIDILKERPLHDVLASIHVEIGICHAVSCVQWCLPKITYNLPLIQIYNPRNAP